MTRYIEVASRRSTTAPTHDRRRLTWEESRDVLEDLACCPADVGAVHLRRLREDGVDVLRVVLEDPRRQDGELTEAGAWLPLAALIRLAEYPDPEREALADAFEAEAHDETERRHQAAHAAGVL